MVRVIYKVNDEETFVGYFRNMMEMLRYEEEAIEDGDKVERISMEKVTIFDVHEDKSLGEVEALEIIFSMLYPTEKLHKVDEVILMAKLVGLVK